jgi:hypothetical protein
MLINSKMQLLLVILLISQMGAFIFIQNPLKETENFLRI